MYVCTYVYIYICTHPLVPYLLWEISSKIFRIGDIHMESNMNRIIPYTVPPCLTGHISVSLYLLSNELPKFAGVMPQVRRGCNSMICLCQGAPWLIREVVPFASIYKIQIYTVHAFYITLFHRKKWGSWFHGSKPAHEINTYWKWSCYLSAWGSTATQYMSHHTKPKH